MEPKSDQQRTFFRLLQATEAPPEVTVDSSLLQVGLGTTQSLAPPAFIAESGYLKAPVGDTSICRGDGMELSQLLHGGWPSGAADAAPIAPLGLDALRGAFAFRDEEAVELAQDDLGASTYIPPVFKADAKSNGKKEEDKKKKKKHKSKHKDRDKHKDKERGSDKKDKHKKRKHREGEETDDRHRSKKSKTSEEKT